MLSFGTSSKKHVTQYNTNMEAFLAFLGVEVMIEKKKSRGTTEGVRTCNFIQYDGISFANLRYNWLRVLLRPDLGPNRFGTFIGFIFGSLSSNDDTT